MNNKGPQQGKSPPTPLKRAAYTLVELLIVVALLGILASVILPSFEPSVHDQLDATARILANDLAFVQNLAMSNGTEYQIEFRIRWNAMRLTHVGSNAAFDNLPSCPFRSANDSLDMRTRFLADLPTNGATVSMRGFGVEGDSIGHSNATLQYDSMGALIPSGFGEGQNVSIWLVAGLNENQRYLPVHINATTGIASVGEYQSAPSDVYFESDHAHESAHNTVFGSGHDYSGHSSGHDSGHDSGIDHAH